MVPRETTVAILSEELPAAQAWAARHAVPMVWAPDTFDLRATLTQPGTDEQFYLRALVDDYRELPPAWTFTDKDWTGAPSMHLFPKVERTPFRAPLFINANGLPVICAPFNRLAYSVHRGPHGDWGGPLSWLTAGQPDQVRALFLGDMLQLIYRDFLLSSGRMG